MVLTMTMIAAAKNKAAEDQEQDDLGEVNDEEDDDDDDYGDDNVVKQTICGQNVDVAKLVADVEFIALVDK